MPSIPISRGPSVAQQPLSGGFIQTPDVTSGQRALAQGLGAAGDAADLMARREAERQANDTQTAIQTAYLTQQQEWMKRQGANAAGLTDEVGKWWQTQADGYGQQLDPMSRQLVSRQLSQLRLQSMQAMGAFQQHQLEGAADSSYEAVKKTIKSTAAANPQVYRVGAGPGGEDIGTTGVDVGVADIREKNAQFAARKGLPPEALAALNLADTTDLHLQVLQGLNGAEPGIQRAYYEKFKDQIDGTKQAEVQHTIAASAAETYLGRGDARALVGAMDRYFGRLPAPAPAATVATPAAAAPRGVRNNNPGNLRAGAQGWQGATGNDDAGFTTFVTPEAGLRAMARNLVSYGDRGIDTLQATVARWAPAAENDTVAYVSAVSKATGIAPDAKIDLHDPAVLAKLVPAMVQHENGQQPYTPEQITAGVNAATGRGSLPELVAPTALTATDLANSPAAAGKPGQTGDVSLDWLTPQQALEFRNRAVADLKRGEVTARAALERKVADYHAMAGSGVVPPAGSAPTQSEFAAAYGEDGQARFEHEVLPYAQLATGLQQLTGASFADRQAAIARAAPQPGAGFADQQAVHDSLVKANKAFEKGLATDPAQVAAVGSPAVQQARAAMQAALADQTATPAQRAAAADAYAQASSAEQLRLGVDRIGADALGEAGKARQPGVRLLTNGEANAIANQFHSSPANAAQLMDGLQAQWGAHFPQVYGQLAADDKLPPAALVIPNMSDPFAKETLARYSDPKLQKEMLENLPAGAGKDIAGKLQQLNESFFNSLAYQGGGQKTFDVIADQQRTLASVYVMQGKSTADAARMAYEQTVGHAYQFADTLRIPRAQQPDQVLKGAAQVAAHPEMLDAAVPASFRPGLTEKDRLAAWHDTLRAGPAWVASADESGAVLYVHGRSEAGAPSLYAVRDATGKPLTWTWTQLRSIAASTPPAPINTTFGVPVPKGTPYSRGETFVSTTPEADRVAGLK